MTRDIGRSLMPPALDKYYYILYCLLYCIVLYCIVLYCIVLYCIVLYCIVLHCIAYSPTENHYRKPLVLQVLGRLAMG